MQRLRRVTHHADRMAHMIIVNICAAPYISLRCTVLQYSTEHKLTELHLEVCAEDSLVSFES